MTLSLPRRPLLDAVASSSHEDHVRLQHTGSHLLIVSADAVVTTATWLPVVETSAPQSVTVPAKLLGASLKALGGDVVEVELGARGVKLNTATARCDVVAQGRLPDLVEVPATAWRGVGDVSTLRSALQACSLAMLDDPARPAVSGVRFDDGVVVAQDGARLHAVRSEHGLGAFTLPAGCVGAVLGVLEGESAATPKKPKKGEAAAPVVAPPQYRIAIGQNFVAVDVVTSTSRRLVVCRRAPEPYAQWRRVLEGLGGAVGAASRDVVMAALKGCPGDAVTLRVEAATLQLHLGYVITDDTSTRRLGGGSTSAPLISATSDFSVKVCTRYLLDTVKCCAEKLTLTCAPGQPLWVKSGDFEGVVMWQR